jgi:uncharacterized membrane protein AbrB (regulator of aidB expression)
MIPITEKEESTVEEVSKSQTVRLIDVFLIAPFLIYIAYNNKNLKEWQMSGLYIIGFATLYYNLKNYLKNE